MNVEICKDNSGTQKMHYFRKNKGGSGPPGSSYLKLQIAVEKSGMFEIHGQNYCRGFDVSNELGINHHHG